MRPKCPTFSSDSQKNSEFKNVSFSIHRLDFADRYDIPASIAAPL